MVLLNSGVGFGLSARIETNPKDYKDALKFLGYPQHPWLKHFPKSIPKEATNVSFYCSKHFLQYSFYMQIRFILPAAKITALLDESQKIEAAVPEEIKTSKREKPPFMPLSAGEKELHLEWPDDFKIIVFHYGGPSYYKDDGYGTQEYWDGKCSYGIAISQRRSEIVYWTEEYPD